MNQITLKFATQLCNLQRFGLFSLVLVTLSTAQFTSYIFVFCRTGAAVREVEDGRRAFARLGDAVDEEEDDPRYRVALGDWSLTGGNRRTPRWLPRCRCSQPVDARALFSYSPLRQHAYQVISRVLLCSPMNQHHGT